MKEKNKFPEAEYRADEIKTLEEKRGSLITEMEQLIGKAKSEVRAFSEYETKRLSEIEKEVEGLNATIEAERRAEAVKASVNAKKQEEQAEQRADVPDGAQQNRNIIKADTYKVVAEISGVSADKAGYISTSCKNLGMTATKKKE